MKQEQKQHTVRCESCGQSFDDRDELMRHNELEHPDLAQTGREQEPTRMPGGA